MDSEHRIYWTDEAVKNLESILLYLEEKWSDKEIENFKKKLGKQIQLIKSNPELFPVSEFNKTFRKAVLSKQTILFYKIDKQIIYLVYLFNTHQTQSRIV